MAQVIAACDRFKDKKPLAEAVRKIVTDLKAEEKAHREAASAEHAANHAKNEAIGLTKDRRFAPEVRTALKALPDEEFRLIESVIKVHIGLPLDSGGEGAH